MGNKRVKGIVKVIPVFKYLVNESKKANDVLFYDAPVIIIIHAKKDHFAKDDAIYASTYLMHAADSLDLGTCVIGFAQAAFDNSKISKKVDIPQGNKIYNTIILGHPKYKYKRNPQRKEAKLKID